MTPDGSPAKQRGLVRPSLNALTAYYVLAETPCPYLAGKWERKLLTEVSGAEAPQRYNLLSRAGFRRSHQFAYRPACSGCDCCVPVRVDADRFRPSRSLRRIRNKNRDLIVTQQPPRATREQFAVFKNYIDTRHGDGEMAEMSLADYRCMVEQTHLESRVAEFRDADGRLLAGCLLDWLEDGPSAVYSFFTASEDARSLGSYVVLWLIEAAQSRGLPYVYLGYWIQDAPKMAYKTRFRPLQALRPGGWQLLAA